MRERSGVGLMATAALLLSLLLSGAHGQAGTQWVRVAPPAGSTLTPRVHSAGFAARTDPSGTQGNVWVYGGVTSADAGVQPGAPRLTYNIPSGVLSEAPEALPFRLDRAAVATSPDGRFVYAFGGVTPAGADSNELVAIDMAVPDPTARNWTLVAPVGPRRPSARKLATLTYLRACNGAVTDGDCLVLVGGDTGGTRLSDVWVFWLLPTKRAWEQPPNSQFARPGAHRSAAAVAAADGGRLFLFGGDVAGGASDNMHVLSPGGFADADPASELANVAAGRPAFSSSIYKIVPLQTALWCGPELAVDGDRSQRLVVTGAAKCAHSNATGTEGRTGPGEFDPWWYVDLGAPVAFQSITVYGRSSLETGGPRMAGWQIWVGDNNTRPNRATASPPGAGANTLCPDMPGDIGGGDVSTVACAATARYVWIYLPPAPTASRFLSLCEVEVNIPKRWQWRRLSGPPVNVARGKPAFASSIYFNGAWAGAPELATDGVTTTTFPFMSHTLEYQPRCDNIHLTVDLLAAYEVRSTTIFSRLEACCAARRSRHELYIGMSRDWRYNTRAWGPLDVSPAGALQSITRTVPRLRGRYVTVRRAPFNPANCADSPNTPTEDDKNVLSLVELEVNAPLLIDQPSARYGAGFTFYRGAFVVFGGNDATGFRLNDVRFFDTNRLVWLAPVAQTPLGTPPQARAWPLLLPLPSNASLGLPTWRAPSTALALLGGAGATGDAIGDFSLLRFAPCSPSPYDAAPGGLHGIVSEDCTAAGTVCSYTCGPGFVPANPSGTGAVTLACSPSGAWQGRLPVCLPAGGLQAATSVTAVLSGNTSATVSWAAVGGGTWPVTAYRVAVKPNDWVESFAGNAFLDASKWRLEPSDTPGLAHRRSFSGGELYLDSAEGATCVTGRYDCLTLTREWPTAESGIAPDGSWAIETYLRMDSTTSRQGQNSNNIGLCIYDPVNVRPGSLSGVTGSCEFYGGVRKTGGSWQYGWESLSGTSTFNTWFDAEAPAAFVRLERNATLPGTFRILFKFRPGDDWIPNPRVAVDSALVGGGIGSPAGIRIGLVARTWSGQTRCLGIFKYLRVMPLGNCAEPGSVRMVPSTNTSAEVTGLSPGVSYAFTVESAAVVQARVLLSPPTTAAQTVAVPPVPPTQWVGGGINVTAVIAARRLVEVLQGKAAGIVQSSYWVNDPIVHGGPAYLNGNVNDYAQAGNGNVIAPDGDWASFDLGVVTSVKALFIVGRQSTCCLPRTQRLQWFVGNSPPVGRAPWRANTECDMSLYPSFTSFTPVFDPSVGLALPYSNYFQCTLTGRYVYLRAPQSLGELNGADGQFNLAELRIYASNSCPPRNGSGTNTITPATCAAGGYGSVCVHACRPGYVAVSGSGVATCGGDSWDAPPLRCSSVCPDLAPPAYRDDCTQRFYSESFSSPTAIAAWASLTPSTQGFGAKWFVADGSLMAVSRTGCFDELHAVIAINKIRDWRSTFTLAVTLSSADRAGVIFKATDEFNMYRFALDFKSATSTHTLERVVNGDVTAVTDVSRPVVPNREYAVRLTMVGSAITITVDGEVWIETNDGLYASGFSGVYAATTAMFSSVAFEVPCSSCQNAQNGETCTYSCQDGLLATGNLTRTCVSNETGTVGFWSPDPIASPLVCTLPPPTFQPSTLTIKEGAPKNAPVGDPLVGQSPAADYQLSWVIVAEAPFDPSVGNLFYIDSCSGQVKVRQGGLLDYERVRQYNLTVRAFILGFDSGPNPARTEAIVPVRLLDVDEAPIVSDVTLLLPENSPSGAVVGSPNWTDPEGSTVTWLLDVDSSGGAFAMNTSSGVVRVSGRFPERLNFELYGATPFELAVTATQPGSVPLLAGSGKVFVQLTDANDAPVIVPGAVLRLTQSALTPGGPVGPVNATDEDGPGSPFAAPLTFSLVPVASVAAGTAGPGCPPPAAPQLYPTLTGAAGSSTLFTINAAGALSVLPTATVPNWASFTPILAFGALARASYSLCVNVSDGRAATVGTVAVVVLADVGSAALIDGVTGVPAAGLSTLGGDALVFTGSGLAAGTLAASYGNAQFSYNASCANGTGSAVTCVTVPGVGAALTWRFAIAGVPVLVTRELVTSYRPPLVTAFVGGVDVSTDGTNASLTVVGAPGTLGPANAAMTFRYGPALEFACAEQASATPQAARTCNLAAGVGALLQWALTIGGQTYTSGDMDTAVAPASAPRISYAAPNITRIVPTCSPAPCAVRHSTGNLSADGGELLRLEGRNFGPARLVTPPDLLVALGGPLGTLVPMACTRGAGAAAHTTLSCIVPPGVGRRHAVSLVVGGQANAAGPYVAPPPPGAPALDANSSGLAYAPPVVTRVYGPGAAGGPTDGGAIIVIDGANFGPLAGVNALARVDYVTYGRGADGGRYAATDCRVIASPTDGTSTASSIQCLTAEGVGAGHALTVGVGEQASAAFAANVSYAPPVLAAYSGPGAANADTVGGEVITITGLNFGPGEGNPQYETYFEALMRVQYGGRLENGPLPAVQYNATNCRVTKPHTEVQCLTAEGAGRGHSYVMFLDAQRSVVPTTAYAAPQVLRVRGLNGLPVVNAPVTGGLEIVVSGRWFGPAAFQGNPNVTLVQSVTFGPTGGEEELPRALWRHVNHTALVVTLPPGFGQTQRFRVTVADQASPASPEAFSYALPAVIRVDPPTGSTFSNPRAPVTVTLVTRNLPLGDPATRITVRFGAGAAPLLISPTVPTTAAAIAAARNPNGDVNITFPLPPAGAGLQQPVRLLVERTGSSRQFTTALTAAAVFSYRPPTIAVVLVSNARWLPANTSRADASDALPCPSGGVPEADGFVATCGDLRYRIEVEGSDFSLFDSDLPGSVGMPYADAADRSISVFLNRSSALGGGYWAVPGSSELYLHSWSHTRIVLASSQSESTLRVTINSTNYLSARESQSAVSAFKAVTLEIVLPLVGAGTPFATDGSDNGFVEMRARGLAGATDLSVQVGPWRVPPTLMLSPSTSAAFTSQAQFMAWFADNLPAADGTWPLRFRVPPGQGRNVPVRLVRTMPDGGVDTSSQAASVSYLPPSLQTLQLLSEDGSTPLGDVLPAAPGVVVRVPTDGRARLRMVGSHFGVSPTFVLGDGFRYTINNTFPCTGPAFAAATIHTCREVPVPEGEGSGLLYPADFPVFSGNTSGFYADVEAQAGSDDNTLQTSVKASFSYLPPSVTSVVSLDPLGFPTRGNVTVLINGANFGSTPVKRGGSESVLRIEFVRITFAPDCIDPVRVNHTQIRCTLPEGSGIDMLIRTTIADLTNSSARIMSYNRPLIVNISSSEGEGAIADVLGPSVNSPYPFVTRGSTNGTAIITLVGTDFGFRSNALHCVFMSWVNRVRGPSDYTLDCNDREDFLGEGEVPESRVLVWTHERIEFQSLPGLGTREINIKVRNAPHKNDGVGRLPYFRYADPVVTRVTPLLFDTEGGDLVEVLGANFGPPLYNRSNLTAYGWTEQPTSDLFDSPTLPVDRAWNLPQALLAVAVHRGCVSTGVNFFGAPLDWPLPTARGATPVSACDRTILSVEHNRIVMLSAPGIGTNRSFAVGVLDGTFTPQSSALVTPLNFSYRAPLIGAFAPQTLRLNPLRPRTVRLEITGSYFGNADLAGADKQAWTDEEKQVGLLLGGAPCVEPPERARVDGSTRVRCLVNEAVTAAGYRNVSIRIAGQEATKDVLPNTTALLVVCAAGSYARIGETCLACPAQGASLAQRGAECEGYIDDAAVPFVDRFTYPRPLPGWFNLNASDRLYPANATADPSEPYLLNGPMSRACPPGRQHFGRDVCIVPCEPAEACLGDNECATGYRSKPPMWRCASCALQFYKRAGQCIRCPDSPWLLVIGFIALIGCAAGLGVILQKKQVNIAVVSIGIDFFQVLAIFSQSKIKWPPEIKELLHVLSAFNLNLEIVAPECLVPDVSYVQKFTAVLLLPLAVGGLMAVMSLALVLLKVVKGRKNNELLKHASAQVGMLLVLMYFLYLYETRTLLDTFNCAPTEPPDGKEYLQVVFEACGEPGGTQEKLLPWSLVGLAVYTVGYPAFVLYWVLYRNRFLIMEDQLLRAKGVGGDRLTNPHAYALRKQYSRSYFQFKPDYWYWFGAIIARKFCIAATSILFNRNATFQMAACLLVMFCAYGLHLACRPYMSPSEYEDVLREHTDKSFTSALHARLRASIVSVESRGRKKVRRNLMTPDGKVDRSAVLGVLTSWLFNYNTIESAMLFAAVIVCLMGLMFDALNRGFASEYAERGTRSVTSVALGVIVLAIVYYFTVLVTEIYMLYTEEQREAALKSAAGRASSRKLDALGGGGKHVGGKPTALPSGLAKGSIYDRTGRGGAGGGGFNTGALDQSFNPLALASARGGDKLGVDAGAQGVVDGVAGMAAPPPPEVWRVVQGTLKDMHSQLVEAKLREVGLMNQLAAAGGGGDGRGEKAAFEPQSTSGAGSARNVANSGLASFRSSRSPR